MYPAAAYPITIATSRDKLSMPKWRNNIPVQVPVAPDDNAVAALLTTVAQHGRTILLFADHADLQGVATQARGGVGMSAAGEDDRAGL